jgi:hypothetical protein
VLAPQEGHISLVEEVELWLYVALWVIKWHRHKEIHRHTENLDIGEEEESSKCIY